MIDIHSHILWGVDDGPKSLEKSLTQLEHARNDGITTLFATSHYNVGLWEVMQERYNELKPHAAKLGIDLVLGCEIDYVHLPTTRPLPTMGGSKFVLIDLCKPYLELSCAQVLFQVSLDGWQAIIAHPERLFMHNNLKIVHELREMDCLFQVNASSLVGSSGKHCQKIAFKIIEAGLASYVGSDAHSQRRNFKMAEARQLVTKKFGGEAAELLFEENARQLMQNQDPFKVRPPKRKWYHFFK